MTSAAARALIVPAMNAGPDDHWYPDLRERLHAAGYSAVDIVTPPPGEPHLNQWLTAIDSTAKGTAYTLVVGHSLGAVAALAWLTQHGGAAVDYYVGLGSFSETLPHLPTTNEFVSAVNADTIRAAVRRRVIAVSEDDYAVPPAMTERAARALGAELARFSTAGHFLRQDGWTDAAPILALLNVKSPDVQFSSTAS